MYAISIILLLFVLPLASIVVEVLWFPGAVLGLALITKWFVFWAAGVRLFLAGVRQMSQPRFTAETIFAIKDEGALPIVREVGFGNLSIGMLGMISLAHTGWVLPAAIVGGLYYGLAGLGHLARGGGNTHERIALASDLLIFALFAVFVLGNLIKAG